MIIKGADLRAKFALVRLNSVEKVLQIVSISYYGFICNHNS